ncbi:MAG: tRNA (N6-isopentenyl adenosine(37)-C2)-methylthiotransferase MiaB [Bacillota bacterium]
MRYSIVTYGCQMNDFDSELMAGLLEQAGYSRAAGPGQADVIVINTCCVRETAENKVWGLLGTLKRLKKRKPGLIIAVTGCLPQQNGAAEEIRRRFPHVDLVLGTHNRHQLPRLLEEVRETREPVCAVWREAGEIVEGLPVRRESKLSAWVPIMFGCDNFCTYCVVPYVRGRERSRRPEDIVREVEALVARGYREVTLLGQNVNSYGRGLEPPTDFAALLQQLDRVEGLWRIRYTTSHPRDFTARLIEVIAKSEKVCEHFHLPAQAGSNRILRRMGRGYTRDDYLRLVEAIRAAIPWASITTDLMVGFPGETEEDFQDTLDLVRRVGFDQAFTFVYNPRKETPAARMGDQVPPEVKSRRIQELIAVQKEISLARNRAEEGKEHEVLVEGPSETDPARLAGRTRTNKTVVFPGPPELIGQLVPVTVVEGRLTHLVGRLAQPAGN